MSVCKCDLKGADLNSDLTSLTSEGACPGLLTPGWSWARVIGVVRRGAGLPSTTVVEVVEVEETGPEAGCGS